jgi:hypothetical protein
MLPVMACALVLTVSVCTACDHGSHACCTKAATAFTPLPSAPAPSFSGSLPLLPSAEPQPFVSGLRAFIDPETGLLTSSIGLLQAPVDLVAEPDYSALPQIQLSDGSFMIDTRGIMMEDVVVHLDALGQRSFACTRDPHAPAAPVLVPTVAPFAER